MTNLRARQLTVRDSTTIEVTYTAGLDHNIGSANVTINGAGSNASGLTVRSVSVSGWTLTVQVQPMAPGVLYEMILASTSSQPFAGTHGERLVEDGAAWRAPAPFSVPQPVWSAVTSALKTPPSSLNP